MDAQQALAELIAGNERFRTGTSHDIQHDVVAHVHGQKPKAIILGCSDSRVPAEIVFDQGLGDLFIIRVAGNVVAPSQIGSVEFAASQFGCPLVVVLGHSQCGAVVATLDEIESGPGAHSPNLASIVDRVRPAVEPIAAQDWVDQDAAIDAAVTANIEQSVAALVHGSSIIESLLEEKTLTIVGAKYDLNTGTVSFV